MASEMYKHLWEPKKTTRDWGTTEYRIIRTWTPRVAAESNTSSGDDQEGQSRDRSPGLQQDNEAALEKDSAEEEEAGTDDEEVEEGAHLSMQSSLQLGGPGRTGPEDGVTEKSTSRIISLTLSSSPGNERSAKRSRISPEESDEGEIEGLEEDVASKTHGSSSHEDEEQCSTRTVQQGFNQERSFRSAASWRKVARANPAVLADSEMKEGKGKRVARETEVETESEPDNVLFVKKSTPKDKVTRKRRKKNTTKTSPFTLWLTPFERTGRDLNELDVCLSTYDSAMRDAIPNESDPEVQRALVQHWKITRKYMLSTIRNLSAVSALEKRHRQEVAKSKKLQRESVDTLKTLKQVNGDNLRRVSMAKQARQAHKLEVERAEIEELSSKISAYVAQHEPQY